MKKIATVLLPILFFCTLFTGCRDSSEGEQGQLLAVYSFSGENETLAISNGVIVLTSTEEIFYGGNLEVNQEKFDDITAYSMTFYIMSDKGKGILISNCVEDMTGETLHVSGEIGKRSGDGIITRESIEELQNNLYFELETTNRSGENNNHQLQLTLKEIIENTDK